ncbi:hypothetical protein GGD83_004920 [Rhodoblastus sphagnicola]|uniref:hypothetical protein n=1 Tax=Rhodoblastus sphagnicola TaxID=333368 RepID=UPI0011B0DBC2|nr:hypothetical protein [Rhodoblastus sphagnicola]MBB4201089.1 hypothetical protein [Rhodoblastus sphagnicola]
MTGVYSINVAEINIFFAKYELTKMVDPCAVARALFHIEEALRELQNMQRENEKKIAETATSAVLPKT